MSVKHRNCTYLVALFRQTYKNLEASDRILQSFCKVLLSFFIFFCWICCDVSVFFTKGIQSFLSDQAGSGLWHYRSNHPGSSHVFQWQTVDLFNHARFHEEWLIFNQMFPAWVVRCEIGISMFFHHDRLCKIILPGASSLTGSYTTVKAMFEYAIISCFFGVCCTLSLPLFIFHIIWSVRI